MISPNELYVFFHISKTGGTSFINHLLSQRERISPHIPLLNGYQRQLALKNNETYWTELPLEEKCRAQYIAGHHAGLAQCSALEPLKTVNYLTVFRDPASRFVSVYNYMKHKGFIDSDISPLQYFETKTLSESQLNFYLRNFLAWDEDKIISLCDTRYRDQRLQEAVEGLEHFFFIGLQESYQHDMLQLTTYLGLPPIAQSYHVAGKDITRFIQVSDQLTRLLRDRYPEEFIFYDEIKRRLRDNGSPFFMDNGIRRGCQTIRALPQYPA